MLAGAWKNPFPGLKPAVAIFAAYLVFDAAKTMIMAPPARPPRKVVFKQEEIGGPVERA